MAAPKLYTHEKHLKRLEDQKGFTIQDIDDEDIIKSIEIFNSYKLKAKGFNPALEKASIKISSAIKRYLDSEYEEFEGETKEEKMVENQIFEPFISETKKDRQMEKDILPIEPILLEGPNPAVDSSNQGCKVNEDVKSTLVTGKKVVKLCKNELALEKIFLEGKKENITKQDLQRAGFDLSFFTCPLTPTGYKGIAYQLIKRKSENNYQLVQL